MLIKEQGPERQPGQCCGCGDGQRQRVLALAPVCTEHRQQHGDGSHHHRFGYALGHEDEPAGRAQPESPGGGAAQCQCCTVVGHRKPGQCGDIGNQLVAAHHQAEATEQEQHCGESVMRPVQFTGGECAEQHRQSYPQSDREPRAVVQRQDRREQPGAGRGNEVEQRRLLDECLAGDLRDQPAATLQDLEHHADGVGLVGFPGVVGNETRQQPGQAEDGDQQGTQGEAHGRHSLLLSLRIIASAGGNGRDAPRWCAMRRESAGAHRSVARRALFPIRLRLP